MDFELFNLFVDYKKLALNEVAFAVVEVAFDMANFDSKDFHQESVDEMVQETKYLLNIQKFDVVMESIEILKNS